MKKSPWRSTVFTGTAGVYYVAYQLAGRQFHAAVTYGNAPSVDILVGLPDGGATLSLQVKASSWALRTKGRGKKKLPHHYEWAVGDKSAKLARPDLFFAFVDLRSGSGQLPDVFIVPSIVIRDAFRGAQLKWWRWHPKTEKIEQYKNKWDILHEHLKKKGLPADAPANPEDT